MKPPLLDGPTLRPLSGATPNAIVVLLHGFGSNGADLISMAPQWRRALPDALFIAPNAPEPCHGSAGGFQWWGLHDLGRPALAAGAARVAPAVNAFIDDRLARYGLSDDRLLLVGFSQGTMLSLHVGPRRERQIAGIIGYSGMLTHPASVAHDILTRPPILLVHGDQDPVIPVHALHEAAIGLRRAGFDVTSHVAAGLGHSVDAMGLQLGEKFARRVLGAGSSSTGG